MSDQRTHEDSIRHVRRRFLDLLLAPWTFLTRFFSSKKASLERLPYRRYHALRALGLEVFFLLQSKTRSSEPAKPVVTSSLWLALKRCSIHVVPVCISITIIILNVMNLYIGSTLPGLIPSDDVNAGLLQVAAKIIEISIVASLTTIVTQILRIRLLNEEGVPFGTVGAAFLFTSISFLISPELWGSISTTTKKSLKKQGADWSKIGLYTLLILCTILAALVGPASAILLIPRSHEWAAGGAQLYEPGETQDLYPTILPTPNSSLPAVCSQFQSAFGISFCPSAGFKSILNLIENNVFLPTNADSYDWTSSSAWRFAAEEHRIANDHFWLRDIIIPFSKRGFTCQTGAVGFRFAEAIRLTGVLWGLIGAINAVPPPPAQGSRSAYRWNDGNIISTSSKVPIVTTACSAAQNVSSTSSNIAFPVISRSDCWNSESSTNVILNQTRSLTSRITWHPLPAQFGPTSTGLLVESPWVDGSDTRVVVGCSISASWSDGNTTNKGYSESAQIGRSAVSVPWGPSSDGNDPNDTGTSWRLITMDRRWLDLVVLSDENATATTPPTTLDMFLSKNIMENLASPRMTAEQVWNTGGVGAFNRSVAIEALLAYMFADALSRESMYNALVPSNETDYYSWTPAYQQEKPDYNERLLDDNDPLIKPDVFPLSSIPAKITILGLAFKAESPTDWVAIGLLSVYVALALSHIIYLVFTRSSSGCWDTLTELLALAHNSRPSKKVLRNTGAGIQTLHTYGQQGYVRAVRDARDTGSTARLELIFEEEDADIVEEDVAEDQDLLGGGVKLAHSRGRSLSPSSFANDNQDQGVSSTRRRLIRAVESDEFYG